MNTRIAFFGTPHIAVAVLEELKHAGILPNAVVTAPDALSGRKLNLTPPPAKIWAQEHSLPLLQPERLDEEFKTNLLYISQTWDLFIVAAYGKIIPQKILDIPMHGSLNMHPSLLPRYRGASPIISQILNNEKEIGVSIMLLDAKMDHGPIIAQKYIDVPTWPIKGSELEHLLSHEGGKLLASIIPDFLDHKIHPQKQDHLKATFTQKISKNDGHIDLSNDPYQNFLKIQAFDTWPRTYFFLERNGKKIRVIITEAEYIKGELIIKKVIPEGKKEMEYSDLLRTVS